MESKLALFVVLIGSIIAMSHLNEETIRRVKRQLMMRHWRTGGPEQRNA